MYLITIIYYNYYYNYYILLYTITIIYITIIYKIISEITGLTWFHFATWGRVIVKMVPGKKAPESVRVRVKVRFRLDLALECGVFFPVGFFPRSSKKVSQISDPTIFETC